MGSTQRSTQAIKKNTVRNVLIILLVFLGLGAIAGGWILIISPSGALIGMPLKLLANSPFSNFLVPGIILFTVLGLAPLLLSVALIKMPVSTLFERFNFFVDMYWVWTYCIYIAFALIVWIQVEMAFIQAVSWLHTFYMFFAVVLIFVALLPSVRSLYKKPSSKNEI